MKIEKEKLMSFIILLEAQLAIMKEKGLMSSSADLKYQMIDHFKRDIRAMEAEKNASHPSPIHCLSVRLDELEARLEALEQDQEYRDTLVMEQVERN